MTNQELRLSVGASPGQRTMAVLAGVFIAAVGAAFVLLPLIAGGLLDRLTGPGDPFASYEEARDLPPGMLPPALRDSGGGGGESGPGPLIGLCGLPFVLLGIYLVLRVLRTAAWLDGSRARVRGALRTRGVDLATARIDAGAMSYRDAGDDFPVGGQRVPTIIATDQGSGRRVTIPLRGMGLGSLPPSELRALADAITTGRPVDGRDGDAHAVASQLRRLAEQPR
ncbi:hypothetical protein [Micromonospora parathelypteridis]|uniref:Uncharacterized protein n=1 Tax=Micromonospora parathelypteridis TaxID=1839617 RepID=A0A840W873_9ACTN|nr:hypothetical protein [Micromonospora parathelypteridis]MBB5479251.1 hypothetical protein [Micromonospora parathelypteridis]GGO02233.1 hypothetical protein GCM10011576_01480 [Micromonospora parathelypteridis]